MRSDREHGAIALRRQLYVLHLASAVPGAGTIFGALLDPFDRAVKAPGGGRHGDLFAHASTLAAEAATHVLDDDAHIGLINPQEIGDGVADAVCRMRGVPDGEACVVDPGERAPWLEAAGKQPTVDEPLPGEQRG